ncbi:hypothetical protein PM082_015346 [Marasmius tenuissimus]|nr:hypothetical protein PM082_015346 [Marasmius tenuissimus]
MGPIVPFYDSGQVSRLRTPFSRPSRPLACLSDETIIMITKRIILILSCSVPAILSIPLAGRHDSRDLGAIGGAVGNIVSGEPCDESTTSTTMAGEPTRKVKARVGMFQVPGPQQAPPRSGLAMEVLEALVLLGEVTNTPRIAPDEPTSTPCEESTTSTNIAGESAHATEDTSAWALSTTTPTSTAKESTGWFGSADSGATISVGIVGVPDGAGKDLTSLIGEATIATVLEVNSAVGVPESAVGEATSVITGVTRILNTASLGEAVIASVQGVIGGASSTLGGPVGDVTTAAGYAIISVGDEVATPFVTITSLVTSVTRAIGEITDDVPPTGTLGSFVAEVTGAVGGVIGTHLSLLCFPLVAYTSFVSRSHVETDATSIIGDIAGSVVPTSTLGDIVAGATGDSTSVIGDVTRTLVSVDVEITRLGEAIVTSVQGVIGQATSIFGTLTSDLAGTAAEATSVVGDVTGTIVPTSTLGNVVIGAAEDLTRVVGGATGGLTSVVAEATSVGEGIVSSVQGVGEATSTLGGLIGDVTGTVEGVSSVVGDQVTTGGLPTITIASILSPLVATMTSAIGEITNNIPLTDSLGGVGTEVTNAIGAERTGFGVVGTLTSDLSGVVADVTSIIGNSAGITVPMGSPGNIGTGTNGDLTSAVKEATGVAVGATSIPISATADITIVGEIVVSSVQGAIGQVTSTARDFVGDKIGAAGGAITLIADQVATEGLPSITITSVSSSVTSMIGEIMHDIPPTGTLGSVATQVTGVLEGVAGEGTGATQDIVGTLTSYLSGGAVADATAITGNIVDTTAVSTSSVGDLVPSTVGAIGTAAG